ncbi:phosphotransferase [Actinomadura fibrosa]|uniref:Phosphotransferase n=1 Tax=Actinomadura fibrosa TaxID=111802 RepID=A0ABW2Y050_9ACTN|nr:phosphotransferase [Actinomadura fibrosa]
MLSRVLREDRRIPAGARFAITGALSRRTDLVERTLTPIGGSPEAPFVQMDPHLWFVRPYVAHDRSPGWNDPALIEGAAVTLAGLHGIAVRLQGVDLPGYDIAELLGRLSPYHWPVWTVLDRYDEFVTEMRKRSRPQADVDTVRRSLERLAKEATELRLGLVGLTHQDYRPDNILVRDGKVVAVIDWALAHRDHFLYDAVLAALHVAGHQPAEDRARATRRFVDAYLDAIDVEAEAAAVRWMFRYVVTRKIAVSGRPEKWRALEAVVGPLAGPGGA